MTIRKVSIRHPHFPEDHVFGVEGVGRLTNDGSPVDVDEEDFANRMGVSLDEALAGSAHLNVEGSKATTTKEIPGITAPAEGSDE